MSQQNIGVGTVPNDGTGDTLRTAFIKTQNNFSEFYSAFTPNVSTNNSLVSNTLYWGNTTVNAVINSSTIVIYSGVTGYMVNSSAISVGNSTVNTFSNATHFYSGNSTVYSFGNSTVDVIANATGQTVITPISFSMGNSTANSSGNSTYEAITNSTAQIWCNPSTLTINSAAANLYVGNSTASFFVANSSAVQVTGNTLTVGSSNTPHTSVSNGYITLLNGMKLLYGTLATVNSTPQVITFASVVGTSFSVNCFSVVCTPNSVIADIGVSTINATAITLYSNSATAITGYWQALGL